MLKAERTLGGSELGVAKPARSPLKPPSVGHAWLWCGGIWFPKTDDGLFASFGGESASEAFAFWANCPLRVLCPEGISAWPCVQ